MIKHVVFWNFKDEALGQTKEENMDAVKSRLLALVDIIPEIKSMQIGKDILGGPMSYDMALIMEFLSMEDLDIYQNHPEHKKVSGFVSEVRTDRCSVDFEF